LNDTQIDSLLQIAQSEQLSGLFKTLLDGVANQKNIVKGNISKVDTVNIGDEIHYHYYAVEKKLPKELTLNIPKTHPDDIVGREGEINSLYYLLNDDK
jgi:hypothetical protein